MAVVDTHCHASPYWFEPVEVLLDEMGRNGVDHAVLTQFFGVYDNSYLVECTKLKPRWDVHMEEVKRRRRTLLQVQAEELYCGA